MTDPNFLFSLPPFIEERDGIRYIALKPSGGDDTPQTQAAVNRLSAVGGGMVRLSVGNFYLDQPFYVDDLIGFGGSVQ